MTHRNATRLALTSLAALILGGCAVGGPADDTENAMSASTPGFEHRAERTLPTAERQLPGGVIGSAISATPVDVVDEGELCVYANEVPDEPYWHTETSLVSGDQLVVQVTLPSCLSQSCDVERQASCDIHVEGNRLVVEASFSYVSIEQGFCTMDCGALTATCKSPALDEGDYEIVFADRLAALPVPSKGDACVIDTSVDCASDGECAGGFCAPTIDDGAVCKPHAQVGDACGGPWPLGMKCAPGLDCTDDPFSPDLPGVCVEDNATK